jgi:hypothetical protein
MQRCLENRHCRARCQASSLKSQPTARRRHSFLDPDMPADQQQINSEAGATTSIDGGTIGQRYMYYGTTTLRRQW